jgi:hypothetical protein
MAKAFGEIEASAEATTLTHPEWLALLLDREVSYRRDKRLLARLRYARLPGVLDVSGDFINDFGRGVITSSASASLNGNSLFDGGSISLSATRKRQPMPRATRSMSGPVSSCLKAACSICRAVVM